MKILKITFICITFFSLLSANSNTNENNIYKEKKIFCSMAGSGNPWGALTKARRPILMAMHAGLNIKRLAEVFNMTEKEIISEIKPLQEYNLVKVTDNSYKPDFFIADFSETEKIFLHANNTGKILADVLLTEWDTLTKAFSGLSLSKSFSLKEQGFMFVGARMLDLGVLGALVRDKSLLTIAPSRPGPDRPDAQYYLWMVEGEPEHLGKYGQDDTDLSWSNWHLLNFGQSFIKGVINLKRKFFSYKAAATIKSNRAQSPELLAKELNIPFLNEEDSKVWQEVSGQVSGKLLKTLKEKSLDFKKFYNTLKTSKYTNNCFGEFFCWYYHISFARAIDVLHEKGAIVIPPDGYSAIVMYREGPEGLLAID